MIVPEWLYQGSTENIPKRMYNPKQLRKIEEENFKLDGEQLNREIAEKMINPYHFTDEALQVGFNVTLDSHHVSLI